MTDVSPISEDDYDAIEAAVMETARGRWFLAEYTRRNRNTDTKMVLGALKRLEDAMALQLQAQKEADAMRAELVEMGAAIAKTRKEIAALKPEGMDNETVFSATDELESIVKVTEKATQDILSTAEQIQEIAWTLRENKADPDLCSALDTYSTDIYIACSFQDLTGQRTARVVEALQMLEKSISSMVDIWYLEEEEVPEDDFVIVDHSERELLNGPSDNGIQQDTVDTLIEDKGVFQTAEETQMMEPHPMPVAPEGEPEDDDIVFMDEREIAEMNASSETVAAPEGDFAIEQLDEPEDHAVEMPAHASGGNDFFANAAHALEEAAHDVHMRMTEARQMKVEAVDAEEVEDIEAAETDVDALSDGQKAALFS